MSDQIEKSLKLIAEMNDTSEITLQELIKQGEQVQRNIQTVDSLDKEIKYSSSLLKKMKSNFVTRCINNFFC